MGFDGEYRPLVIWLNELADAEAAEPPRFNIGRAGFHHDHPVATSGGYLMAAVADRLIASIGAAAEFQSIP